MYRWGLTLSFASLALMLESSFIGIVLAGIAGYVFGGLIDRNRRNQKMYQLWTAAMESPEGVQALIESGANLEGHDRHTGWTILHRTAGANSPESTRALVEAGANIAARDANERTPLHHAAINNATETEKNGLRNIDEEGKHVSPESKYVPGLSENSVDGGVAVSYIGIAESRFLERRSKCPTYATKPRR